MRASEALRPCAVKWPVAEKQPHCLLSSCLMAFRQRPQKCHAGVLMLAARKENEGRGAPR